MRKTTVSKSIKLINEQRFHTERLGFNDQGIIIDARGVEYDGVCRNQHHIYIAVASFYGLSTRINKIKLATQLASEEDQHTRETLYRTPEGDVFEVVEMSNISGLIIRDLSAKCREQSGKEMFGIGAVGEFAFGKAFGREEEIPTRSLPSTNPYGHYDLAGYRISIITQPIASSLIAVPSIPRADLFVIVQVANENAFRLPGWCTHEELLQHRERIDLGFQTVFAIRGQHLRDIHDLAPLLQG